MIPSSLAARGARLISCPRDVTENPAHGREAGPVRGAKRRNVFRAAGMYLVVAWLLLQVGETTFEALGLPDGSQRFLIVLLALGFPVALVVAWIFDLTPEGIVRTSDDPAAEMASLRMGRRIDFAIIGSLLIVVGLMFWQAVPPPVSEEPPLSDKPGIAVLPFCNLSGDPEQEYFSDGISEDLTAVLSRSPDLLVISRTSSSRYACQPADLKQVGRELGVRYAVEGSVRRAQDRVRITAQLIDATTDVHVWSRSYERELTPANVFDIQSDIAQQISNALQVQLREWEGQGPTASPTAWEFVHDQQLDPRAPTPGMWAFWGTLHYLEGEIDQAVALWERARTMAPLIAADRIMLTHYYESAGSHEYAQAIVQEMLSTQPELTAERASRSWRASGTRSGSPPISKRSCGVPGCREGGPRVRRPGGRDPRRGAQSRGVMTSRFDADGLGR